MLVLKSSGIDLSKSETRTIIGFSLIYSILVLVILGVITFLYYQFKKDLMLQDVRQTLQNYSNTHIANLKELHINIDNQIYIQEMKDLILPFMIVQKRRFFQLYLWVM